MWKLKVVLAASKNKLEIPVRDSELSMSLLDFLRLNQLPVASSCSGEGVCKKCIVNKNILSCMTTVERAMIELGDIEIEYL